MEFKHYDVVKVGKRLSNKRVEKYLIENFKPEMVSAIYDFKSSMSLAHNDCKFDYQVTEDKDLIISAYNKVGTYLGMTRVGEYK